MLKENERKIKNQRALAAAIGISPSRLSDIKRGQPASINTARKLSRITETNALLWMDGPRAKREAAIRRLLAAAKQ